MKKVLSLFFGTLFACSVAFADARYTETEVVTTWENLEVVIEAPAQPQRFYSSRDVVRPNLRSCVRHAGKPIRVKTHTEVIDHYQVFQPVTVYRPMGTQIQRRVVPAEKCNSCF